MTRTAKLTRLLLVSPVLVVNLLATSTSAESRRTREPHGKLKNIGEESRFENPASDPPALRVLEDRASYAEAPIAVQAAFLPTRSFIKEALPEDESPPVEPIGETAASLPAASKRRISDLMKPTISWEGEWQAEVNDFALFSQDVGLKIPGYPIFGPPPPMVVVGFSYTDISAPDSMRLPNALYDYSLGLSWVRKISERWSVRFFSSVAIATDGENLTSDAWQFRGGIFAMKQSTPEITWLFGALALGRIDIPVVPAAGLVWIPNPRLKVDLVLPKPKIAYLLKDHQTRQHWGTVGMGLNGGTWGYQQAVGNNDQLTYRDWRVALGWESVPTPEPGVPFTRGRRLGFDIGYLFGRKFEFNDGMPDLNLDDTLMLRGMLSF